MQRSESTPFSLPSEPPPVRVSRSFDDVFPDLHIERSRDRYLVGLSAEGIFPLAAPAAAPPSAVPPAAEPLVEVRPPAEPEPFPALAEPPIPLPVAEAEPFDLSAPLPQPAFAPEPAAWSAPLEPFHLEAPLLTPRFEPEPAPEPLLEPAAGGGGEVGLPDLEPAVLPEPVPPAPYATVTLAEMYVSQGYPDEAERTYREVLEREPESVAARSGLDRLSRMERRQRRLEARDLLAGYSAAETVGDPETGQVRHMLHSYLQRLRERSPRDVS